MKRVDQFPLRRRRLRQNAEPGEGIIALISHERSRWEARAADAMRAVAAADKVAGDFLLRARMPEGDCRPLASEAMQAHVVDLKENFPPVGEPLRDQILDDLLLAIDRDPLADQTTEI